jgi:hypothetical protein
MKRNKGYDSTDDTLNHKHSVFHVLYIFIDLLRGRASSHDDSKLLDKEKPYFDKMTPLLKNLEYGTKEYTNALKQLKVALDNHYKVNCHHPEHFENGIKDMTLVDILEMLSDWCASVKRTKDGNIYKSIEINQKRFGYSDDLKCIFENTVKMIYGEPNGKDC